jgi:hypothetical protein
MDMFIILIKEKVSHVNMLQSNKLLNVCLLHVGQLYLNSVLKLFLTSTN